ncbi:hypothetical protein M3204_22845 [Mesobacillus subterraneus]|uniref:hypothetical protein n=1 Tax=Mesobacillus subterraneus TaxID=285983 RepID=UPI00203B7468|nr:hypothetical protein [Mesobacillus subterraneus]MCM3667239.1 hypothetical protein [Mesobacillus subterraneus]MCM3686172.1 hypothetical protein [Mesobacillus subterraneus]
MKKEIKELLDDPNTFARQIANIELSNLSFDVHEYRDKFVKQVDIVFAEKSQFNNIKEAFSAIFKKQLFDGEEWNINEEPKNTDEVWIKALKNYFINDYYPREIIYIELVEKDDFINRFKRDLSDVNVQESVIEGLLSRLKDIEPIQVKKGHVYDCIFGQSDSHYFLYEWGIYN